MRKPAILVIRSSGLYPLSRAVALRRDPPALPPSPTAIPYNHRVRIVARPPPPRRSSAADVHYPGGFRGRCYGVRAGGGGSDERRADASPAAGTPPLPFT